MVCSGGVIVVLWFATEFFPSLMFVVDLSSRCRVYHG